MTSASPPVLGLPYSGHNFHEPGTHPNQRARVGFNPLVRTHLTLAKLIELFSRQPEKLPLYMTQHLLEDHPAPPEEEPEPTPVPDPEG